MSESLFKFCIASAAHHARMIANLSGLRSWPALEFWAVQFRRISTVAVVACIAGTISSGLALADEAAMPWKTSTPIVEVTRQCMFKSPKPKTCAYVFRQYVGTKLELLEQRALESRSDFLSSITWRVSRDNGRTWSEPWALPDHSVHHAGVEFFEGFLPMFHDPKTDLLVATWLRQINHRGLFYNFCYSRTSHDMGRTWSEPVQLCYEPAQKFNPDDPLAPGFLEKNHAYPGSNIIRHSNGTLIHCVAHANAPGDRKNSQMAWRMGSLCFIGRWDPTADDYRWMPGKRLEISPQKSSRGLMEPEVAELKDGRVLVIWRGSNTATTPGRKWFSTSSDGGQTLAPVEELRYDDGSRFYSPSSYNSMIRHRGTGKLYWVGNICSSPPNGNEPRYPLLIAEIDEEKPAIKRSTVTVIDDCRPGDSDSVQLSNFALIENRQTHDLEVYMSRLGANPKDFWGSDSFQYTLKLKP